jgi:glycosyltransferase involved in cell wall biosynthesis
LGKEPATMNGPVPRVSAILIVFNGREFIEEAIASIAEQSMADWELLIVDDGSTDGTVPLVRDLIRRDPARMRLLFHPDRGNHGMSATRNLGLSQARGEFVAFLDADDVWLPHKLEEQTAILDRDTACAMVYGRTLIWHSWNPNASEPDFFYDLGVEADASYAPPLLFTQLVRNRFQTPTTCNAMMRRDTMFEVGGFDDRFRDMFEDQLFFAKMLLRYPVHVSSECWAKYRQHPAASSHGFEDRDILNEAQIRYLRALKAHAAGTKRMLSRPRFAIDREIAALQLRAAARRIKALRMMRGWI